MLAESILSLVGIKTVENECGEEILNLVRNFYPNFGKSSVLCVIIVIIDILISSCLSIHKLAMIKLRK